MSATATTQPPRYSARQTAILETPAATYWIDLAPYPASDTRYVVEVRTRWRGQGGSFHAGTTVYESEQEARAGANALWLRLRNQDAEAGS